MENMGSQAKAIGYRYQSPAGIIKRQHDDCQEDLFGPDRPGIVATTCTKLIIWLKWFDNNKITSHDVTAQIRKMITNGGRSHAALSGKRARAIGEYYMSLESMRVEKGERNKVSLRSIPKEMLEILIS